MSFPDTARLALTRRRFDRIRERTSTTGAEPQRRVRRIVLTGGPGSGKSTAAAFLAREFHSEVWVLPEAATLLYRGGLPRGEGELGVQIAQRAIFSTQRSLEHAHGVQHPDRVQLCDRGTVDGAAYWPTGEASFFAAVGSSRERELARYDAVVFLRTAATLPAGYERDLEVRTEDVDQAIALDEKMFALFRDHPRLIVVESTGSFLQKLTAVSAAVGELVRGDLRPEPIAAGALANLAGLDPSLLP